MKSLKKLNALRMLPILFALFSLFAATQTVAATGGQMPSFSLESALDGKSVSSGEFEGKALLITFFATWCPPCRQEIPTLIELQNEYGSRGFSVVGLSLDEKGPKVVVKLIKKQKINYPILMADSKTARAFGGIAGIPTSFLVDRKGVIVKRYPGYVPHSLLEKDIKSIL